MPKLSLEDTGEFTWGYGTTFFVETSKGNYVWSDPDYGGDNTLVKFGGSYRFWLKEIGIPFGRDKGKYTIGRYCGPDVKIID